MLVESGKKFGFSVTDTASYKLADCRISSTEIRQALEQEDFAQAEKMLGRPYSIMGRVFHGDKRGRQLGYPTANVLLKRRVSPILEFMLLKLLLKQVSTLALLMLVHDQPFLEYDNN